MIVIGAENTETEIARRRDINPLVDLDEPNVIYHIYIKCYLRFIPTIPIPASRLSPLFLIPILFL